MPRLNGGAGAQSALAQAAGGVPPRSTSSGQLPESQVAPCGAASAVARSYGVPESGQTSHNGGRAGEKGISQQQLCLRSRTTRNLARGTPEQSTREPSPSSSQRL